MDFTQLFTAFMTTSEYIFLPKRPDALKAFLRKKTPNRERTVLFDILQLFCF